MKLIKQNTAISEHYRSKHYYDDNENKLLKKARLFKLFLYTTVVLFALSGITVITLYAVNLGILVTIAASISIGGWWAAYTLIVMQEIIKDE